MTKVLVTGANGFIGKYLIPDLENSGYDIIAIDRSYGDIAEENTWSRFPRSDVVMHLAGKTFVPESWVKIFEYINCNLFGVLSALNYCKNNNSKLIILSSYLYGNLGNMPINESSTLVANNPYGLSKKLSEDVCQFYFNSYGLDITIIRPFNIYGYGQGSDFLIPRIIHQVSANENIKINDLKPKRDYVYIKDVINAITQSIKIKKGIHTLNIGRGKSYSVAEVIQIIQNIMNTKLNVDVTGKERNNEIYDTVADISKAKEVLNWIPKYNLFDGISDYLRVMNLNKV